VYRLGYFRRVDGEYCDMRGRFDIGNCNYEHRNEFHEY
jgi:hypothetical protein